MRWLFGVILPLLLFIILVHGDIPITSVCIILFFVFFYFEFNVDFYLFVCLIVNNNLIFSFFPLEPKEQA